MKTVKPVTEWESFFSEFYELLSKHRVSIDVPRYRENKRFRFKRGRVSIEISTRGLNKEALRKYFISNEPKGGEK